MKIFSFIFSLLISNTAFAGTAEIFGGFGLTGGQSKFDITSPEPATSKFTTLGYLIEGGCTMGDKWGFQGSGEIGQMNANNTISSTTYLEAATNSYYAAKVGMYFNGITNFGFGFGYRLSDWNVKSVSLDNNKFNNVKYSGTDNLIYANFSMDMNKRYRSSIEIQSVAGKLKSKESVASDIKYSETLISLRFFVLFN